MTNHHGVKGRVWTDAEVELLKKLAPKLKRREIGQHEVAKALGRSISSVEGKLRAVRANENLLGELRGPGLSRYETPHEIESDDAEHLERVLKSRPSGFPVAFSRPHYRVRSA